MAARTDVSKERLMVILSALARRRHQITLELRERLVTHFDLLEEVAKRPLPERDQMLKFFDEIVNPELPPEVIQNWAQQLLARDADHPDAIHAWKTVDMLGELGARLGLSVEELIEAPDMSDALTRETNTREEFVGHQPAWAEHALDANIMREVVNEGPPMRDSERAGYVKDILLNHMLLTGLILLLRRAWLEEAADRIYGRK